MDDFLVFMVGLMLVAAAIVAAVTVAVAVALAAGLVWLIAWGGHLWSKRSAENSNPSRKRDRQA